MMRRIYLMSCLVMSLALLLMTSCKKEHTKPGGHKNHSDQASKAKELLKKIPEIRIITGNGKQVRLNLRTGSYSFADPEPGYTYAAPDGSYYYYEGDGQKGGYIAIKATAFGETGGGSGGTVVAGNTELDINYTFCFAAKDSNEADGFNFFGPSFNGVSLIVGLSGDLNKLMEEGLEDDEVFGTYIKGFAVYIVYASPASGSYDVVDWLENIGTIESGDDQTIQRKLKNKGFAYILSYKNPEEGYIYLSKSGQLDVQGGSINFSGKYFEIFSSEEDPDIDNLKEVSGYGGMSCNK